MVHMTSWVRQYALRDLLDDSFDLFKERAATLLLAGALPFVVVVLYVVVMRLYVIPEHLTPQLYPDMSPDQVFDELQRTVRNPRYLWYAGGLWALFTAAICAGYTMQCRVALHHALGQSFPLRQAARRLAKPGFSLLLIAIIVGVTAVPIGGVTAAVIGVVCSLIGLLLSALGDAGSTIAAVLAMVGGTVSVLLVLTGVATYVLTAPMVVAIEHLGPFAALGRSIRLASANFKAYLFGFYAFWHIPALLALAVAGASTLLMQVRMVVPAFSEGVLGVVVMVAGTVLMLGMSACFQALAYIDGRCRRESFDLLLLAREIGLGDEFERAYLAQTQPVRTAPAYAPAAYPNYAAPPTPTAGEATPAFPDYSMAPAAPTEEADALPDAPPPPAEPTEVTDHA